MPKTKRSGQKPNWPEWKVKMEIKKAKTEATKQASSMTVDLMLLVLQDKFGMSDKIYDVWLEWNKYAEAVTDGTVKLHEVRNVLRKEYGIGV